MILLRKKRILGWSYVSTNPIDKLTLPLNPCLHMGLGGMPPPGRFCALYAKFFEARDLIFVVAVF